MYKYYRFGKNLKVGLAVILITVSTSISRPAAAYANDLVPIFMINWIHSLLIPIVLINLQQHRLNKFDTDHQPQMLTMNQDHSVFAYNQTKSDDLMGLGVIANSNSVSSNNMGTRSLGGSLGQIHANGKGIDGQQTVLNVALPIIHNDDMTFGVLVGAGESDVDWDRFQGDMDSDIRRAGVFVAMAPTPDTRLEFDYTFTRMDTDFELIGSSGRFDSDIHDFRAQISKRFDQKSYWVETAAGLHYGKVHRDSFVDTLWSEKTPKDKTDLSRVFGSVGVVVPNSSGTIFVKATAFHDNYGSVPRDPTFPVDARPDEKYWGFAGAVGGTIEVSKNVTVGGSLTGFEAGDLDGHEVRAFVNIGLE